MSNLAQTSPQSPAKCSSGPRPRNVARLLIGDQGFTLVEVLVSAFVLVVALSTFLGTVIQAYRIEEAARRRDQVRAILQSFADQFNRGAITYFDANDGNRKKINDMFDPHNSPIATGFGLRWTDSNNVLYTGAVGAPNLKLRLGDDAKAPEVTLTRQVWEMNEATGAPDPGGPSAPLETTELAAEFIATWSVDQHPQIIKLRVVRCADSTGVADPAP